MIQRTDSKKQKYWKSKEDMSEMTASCDPHRNLNLQTVARGYLLEHQRESVRINKGLITVSLRNRHVEHDQIYK
jgi:hypothetical protein